VNQEDAGRLEGYQKGPRFLKACMKSGKNICIRCGMPVTVFSDEVEYFLSGDQTPCLVDWCCNGPNV